MTHWLYLPNLETTGNEEILEGVEATHAVRARRLRIDDLVCVFDGIGRSAAARISEVTQRPLQVHLVIDHYEHWPPPATGFTLSALCPKVTVRLRCWIWQPNWG